MDLPTGEEKPKFGTKKYIVLFLSEFLGTAIMMYIGTLGCALPKYRDLQPLLIAFTFACGIMASIQIFGHISGPHLNPGVTLGILILGKIDWKKTLVYLAGQYTGAFFGYAMMFVQIPKASEAMKPCALAVAPYLTPAQVFFLEFSASMILFMAVGGVKDAANATIKESVTLRLGFVIFGLIVATADLSGACLNSARALPSAVLNNAFEHHWIYHAAPVLGQCAGACLYKFLFDTTDKYSLNKNELD